MRFFTRAITVFFLLFSSLQGYAATIKGHVYDKSSKEQLVGAYVTIKSLAKGTTTELDGSFTLKDVPAGTYAVTITYLGFDNIDSNIVIRENGEIFHLEISLSPASQEMKQVEIKGKAYGGSDEFATREEQKSLSIVNILSANAIQMSPDITVGNVMQRISGVVMTTGVAGVARYAIIRGMDPKYNVTLVNGVKIPSPNNKDRYIPMDIFPAEMLERLEVVKTLMPSMEADATGGTVNMVMKSAPEKLMVEASIGAGYNDIFQNRDFQKFDASGVSLKAPSEITGPNVGASPSDFPYKNLMTANLHSPANSVASFTIGNRFFHNKLGVVLASSFQDLAIGVNSGVLVENATVPPSTGPNVNNTQSFSDILERQYSFRQVRSGTEAKVSYTLNDKNSLDLFLMYAQLNEYRVRSTIDSQLGGYSLHNFVGPVSISDEIQTMQTLQAIYNITLQGHHTILPNLSADWSLVTSQATQKMPDIATFSTQQGAIPDIAAQTLALSAPTPGNESREWEHNTDKDFSAYVNLHYNTDLIPTLKRIDFGGMFRARDRDNFYTKYSLKPVNDTSFTSIPATLFFFTTNAQYGNGNENAGTYTFTENISAYYVQLHDEIGERIKIDGGVRVENTDQSYNSSLPASFAGKSATYTYTDVLPSVQVKYEINTKSAVRLDYYASIYRPAFADLIPFPDPNANETYTFQGNDSLQHTYINNFDARYELFPKGLDELLVGVFYKHLTNPIENILVESGRTSTEILSPANVASDAQNTGFELMARKFFGNFGASFNYTYTYSEIASEKLVYWANAASGTHYDNVFPSRPLEGVAPNIGNLSFLYKDLKHKIESQLALSYVGERIYAVSLYRGLDSWEKPSTTLNFSAQKGIGKNFTIFFKANNLLNTPFELVIKQPSTVFTGNTRLPLQESNNYVTVQKDLYYRTFLIGLRYKL